jgi:hypothetical protein
MSVARSLGGVDGKIAAKGLIEGKAGVVAPGSSVGNST